MDDTTFLATWDDTGNVGIVSLTKAELQKFTTSTGSDSGEHITSIFDKTPFSLVSCVRRTVRSQTRNTDGNGRATSSV